MKGNSCLEWIKTLLIYGILAWISFLMTSRGSYVLIWLPAGYGIYAMIRGKLFTLGALFLGGTLFYGSIIVHAASDISSINTGIIGMVLFGIIESLNGLIGQLLYKRIKRNESHEEIKLGVMLVQVLMLPSILAGFLFSFVNLKFPAPDYSVVLSGWFSVSVAYFLGSSLLLPFYYYYHKEKNRVVEFLRLEMRWTFLLMILAALIVSIYFWPKAFIGALFLAIILLPKVNGTIGTALILCLSMVMANKLIIATRFEAIGVWQLYGTLLVDVLAIVIGFNFIIKLLLDHKKEINDLEDIIGDRMEKIDIYLGRIDELSAYDQLTGTLNRASFIVRGEQEITRMKRYKRSLALMHVDIDQLKAINEEYGYQVGDRVIIGISEICQDIIRTSDLIARVAGDEFAILMPETTEVDAIVAAEKIRKAIAQFTIKIEHETNLSVTASIGVTACFDAIDQCMVSADTALYRAKKTGRNKVILSSKL